MTHVFAHELDHSPLAGTSEWLQAPLWVVPALMAVGWTLWAFAVTSLAPGSPSAPDPVAAVAPPARDRAAGYAGGVIVTSAAASSEVSRGAVRRTSWTMCSATPAMGPRHSASTQRCVRESGRKRTA